MELQKLSGEFREIRPYFDSEVNEVLKELANDEAIVQALAAYFPEKSQPELITYLRSVNSVGQFQSGLISNVVERIIKDTTGGIRVSGLDNISGEPAVFISNHRDIVLDSAIFNYTLHKNKFATTRIAIGDNLLQLPWIEKLVRLNKNFIVHRNVQARQAYEYSLRLSRYIYHSLKNEGESVWIAQREGRTKDGRDRTQAGLLKMLGMWAGKESAAAYAELNITPVSISYEIEPWAGMKAKESAVKSKGESYVKSPGEDLRSMRDGITLPKGRIHLSFGKKLSREELESAFEGRNRNDALRELAELIDRRIISDFHLFPGHYIAYDLENGSNEYQSFYTAQQKEEFFSYLNSEVEKAGLDEIGRQFLIGIYSNSVRDKALIRK